MNLNLSAAFNYVISCIFIWNRWGMTKRRAYQKTWKCMELKIHETRTWIEPWKRRNLFWNIMSHLVFREKGIKWGGGKNISSFLRSMIQNFFFNFSFRSATTFLVFEFIFKKIKCCICQNGGYWREEISMVSDSRIFSILFGVDGRRARI